MVESNLDRLLTVAEVLEATGLSRSTVYVLMRQGGFPEPLKVGPRAVRWRLSEIEDWQATRARAKGDLVQESRQVSLFSLPL